MYDEVSHRTPAPNALQLEITDIFAKHTDITIVYRPSKTNTTAVRRTCKSIYSNTLAAFVSCATISFLVIANVMKSFALQYRE
jgi:hypothetical protein